MGRRKVRTSPYHAQTNKQVEWAHQMLMYMIGELCRIWKANLPKHLSELVHAYNLTRLAITRYIPYYLMFRCWLCLPVNSFFPMVRGMRKHQHVYHYIAELCEWLWEAFKKAQVQSMSEAKRQKQHYNRKVNAISLEPGALVLAKANACRGRRKEKDQWEGGGPYKVEHQVVEDIPSYLMKNQQTGCLWVLHQNWLFLIAPTEGIPLCMIVWAKQASCTMTTLEEQTPEESETEKVPQSVSCLSLAQCQTGETPLGSVNRRLCAVIRIFPRASLLDKGVKSLM